MEQAEQVTNALRAELQSVIIDAHAISRDVGKEVESLVKDGMDNPLSPEAAARLLETIIVTVKARAARRGDTDTVDALTGREEEIVGRMIETRERVLASRPRVVPKLKLAAHNGIEPSVVFPTPYFHGRSIPMNSGHVRTLDIKLWHENDRLQIHVNQFRRLNNRAPNADELLDIMLNKVELPGVDTEADAFEIRDLARSIANNGVRKPPIISVDGRLLDGNRRLTACHFILHGNDFTTIQKQRVEQMFVWQLTEHATTEDENAVVVSLNFESDCKQDWPKYVKARKVYEEWVAMLAMNPRASAVKQRELKRELSEKFALGPKIDVVNRYIKMVEWADDFESYLVTEQERDQYEVKHRANEKFEYFDELSKGDKAGGVAFTLGQNDHYKRVVFDLLFENKFRNWSLIRKLKYFDDDVYKQLVEARDEKDIDVAEDKVDRALTDAHNRQRENRVVGAEARIDAFVKWMDSLPASAFQRDVARPTLQRLLDAVQLVGATVEAYDRKTAKAAGAQEAS